MQAVDARGNSALKIICEENTTIPFPASTRLLFAVRTSDPLMRKLWGPGAHRGSPAEAVPHPAKGGLLRRRRRRRRTVSLRCAVHHPRRRSSGHPSAWTGWRRPAPTFLRGAMSHLFQGYTLTARLVPLVGWRGTCPGVPAERTRGSLDGAGACLFRGRARAAPPERQGVPSASQQRTGHPPLPHARRGSSSAIDGNGWRDEASQKQAAGMVRV